MHEKKQRLVCRAGFLILCLVPTLVVAVLVGMRLRPGRVASYEQAIADRLGVSVSLYDVTHPRPGVMRLTGVQLNDPETGHLIAKASEIEYRSGGSHNSLYLSDPELELNQMTRLNTAVDHFVMRRPSDQSSKIVIHTNHLALRGNREQGVTILDSVRGLMTASRATTRLALNCTLAGKVTAELRVTRNRTGDRPETRLLFDTGEGIVPGVPVSYAMGQLASLGDHWTFGGSIEARQGPDGWNGQLSGVIGGVDLDRAIGQQFPHELSGTARLEIVQARFEKSRIIEATGNANAGPGLIGGSLIRSATDSLGLATVISPAIDGPPVIPYEQMAFIFFMSADGIAFQGTCDNQGTILRDSRSVIAKDGGSGRRPLDKLVRTLAPTGDEMVPYSPRTYNLTEWLPEPRMAKEDGPETPKSY